MFSAVLLGIVGVASIIFGLMVLLYGGKLASTRWFFVAIVSNGLWAIGLALFLTLSPGQSHVALLTAQTYYVTASLIALSMLMLILTLSSDKQSTGVRLVAIIPWILLSITIFLYPSFIIEEVVYRDTQYYAEMADGYAVYMVFFVAYYVISISAGIIRYMREKDKLLKTQLVSILGAYFIAGILGMIFDLLLPAAGNYSLIWIGPLGTFIFIPIIYTAIVRYQLFDIRLAIVRSVGYALTISAMAGIYVLLAYAMSMVFFGGAVADGVGLSPANIAIALILALIFQPIKQFFDHWTNKIFYRGTYSRESFIRDFGKIISYDTNLALLLKRSGTFIKEKLNAESVSFYVNGRTVFAANSHPKKRVLPTDIDMIGAYYRKHHEFPAVLVGDMVESDQIRGILKAYQVHIVLPLMLQGQALGFLFIGEHKSRGYTMRDVRVIESIANELTIAVQNSLSVEEIRELNESLQQRVDVATKELRESNRQLQRLDEAKSEFVSMASHQLRTPLTSIKGYLDMVLQGDLGKVSATQRAVLSEAFLSSERMVTLINDFLNISRLQTGKFVIDRTEGDLKELVVSQISMLQVIAKQHNLTIKETIDKTVPSMNIDVDKLRQVIVNFIDNAIYYSKPGTIVRVKLVREKGHIVFTVKDTGIGVPESEKAKLFTRFFRAQNARRRRPDGTGVGLFLAKKVVVLHGGQIIFESEEDKGSLFGFRVPIS